jgi:hypothetical protein
MQQKSTGEDSKTPFHSQLLTRPDHFEGEDKNALIFQTGYLSLDSAIWTPVLEFVGGAFYHRQMTAMTRKKERERKRERATLKLVGGELCSVVSLFLGLAYHSGFVSLWCFALRFHSTTD